MIKSEFLMLKSSFNKSDFIKLSLSVDDGEISSSSTAKNFGVILGCHLKLDKFMNAAIIIFDIKYVLYHTALIV